MSLAQSMCRNVPRRSIVRSTQGWPLDVTYSRNVNDGVFFFGEYEPGLSAIIKDLVEPGDTCFDIGANFGWYTMLFSHLCGKNGAVHSFEPVPGALRQLRANVELLGDDPNVTVNGLALGDQEGEITINTFEDLGLGYSSISDLGRDDAKPVTCRMTTLDQYFQENEIKNFSFLKADIEGAELMLFKGAEAVFRERPPLMMIEISASLTACFDYSPNDLLDQISNMADYRFYTADEVSGSMMHFERFSPDDAGGYVFCLPVKGFENRVKRLSSRIR